MKNILNGLIEKRRKKTVDKILEAKELFDDTVQQAIQDSGTLSKTASDAKSYVDSEFTKLLQEANQAVSGFDKFSERAKEITQHQAYIIPASELFIASRSLLDEIKEWGIYSENLTRLEELVSSEAIQSNNETKARHRLYRIIGKYNYWRKNALRYHAALKQMKSSLLIAMCFFLFWAYDTNLENYFSFILAGLSGALASVILKSPPLNIYSHLLSLYINIAGRIASGVISSAVCYGLMATGIVNIFNTVSYMEDLYSLDYKGKVILISIGILTGFSERAIYSFSTVFETSIAIRKDRRKGKDKQSEGKRE